MKSTFDGGILGYLGTMIVTGLIITFTLGIATPWAICYYQRWLTKHTVIEGRRLTFNGKGGELFGKFIVWFLLSIITLGIYSLWLAIKMQKWIVSHTHFE